jgi:hypothetical protein
MKPWPTSIPHDLRCDLEPILRFRSLQTSDIWAAVREWLEHHQVEPPATLPADPRPSWMRE